MTAPWQAIHRAAESPQVSYKVPDPGDAGELFDNIAGVSPAYVEITTAGAETRTLADPTVVGQLLIITFYDDGGNCVITTATKHTVAGATTITLADVGDTAILVAVNNDTDGLRWSLLATEGI